MTLWKSIFFSIIWAHSSTHGHESRMHTLRALDARMYALPAQARSSILSNLIKVTYHIQACSEVGIYFTFIHIFSFGDTNVRFTNLDCHSYTRDRNHRLKTIVPTVKQSKILSSALVYRVMPHSSFKHVP